MLLCHGLLSGGEDCVDRDPESLRAIYDEQAFLLRINAPSHNVLQNSVTIVAFSVAPSRMLSTAVIAIHMRGPFVTGRKFTVNLTVGINWCHHFRGKECVVLSLTVRLTHTASTNWAV